DQVRGADGFIGKGHPDKLLGHTIAGGRALGDDVQFGAGSRGRGRLLRSTGAAGTGHLSVSSGADKSQQTCQKQSGLERHTTSTKGKQMLLRGGGLTGRAGKKPQEKTVTARFPCALYC